MKSTKAGIRYAKALLEMAIEQKVIDLVSLDMARILGVADSSPDFISFLNSPIIKSDKKIAVISKIFVDLQPLTARFVALIVMNGRSEMLPNIASGYSSLLESHRGIVSGNITSAVALDAQSRKKIMDKLAKTFTGELQLTEKIDPSLIGGFIITIGDNQIDASVSSKIKNLRQELTK
jgi:F-type H+-transporting ATPase subunit delta